MAGKWSIKLINPDHIIKQAVSQIWAGVMADMEKWITKELVPALTYGSASPKGNLGLQGIADTAFYKFITGPQGISELGISPVDAVKLLRAYENSMKVSYNNNLIILRFGDMAQLKAATPHSDKDVTVQSWLEWIVDGVPIAGYGFVPANELPKNLQDTPRSRPGGLMLKKGEYGSTGQWKFPQQFAHYDSDWLAFNAAKLEKLIVEQAIIFFNKRALK